MGVCQRRAMSFDWDLITNHTRRNTPREVNRRATCKAYFWTHHKPWYHFYLPPTSKYNTFITKYGNVQSNQSTSKVIMCSMISSFIIRYTWITYSISFLIRTPTFEWCVFRCGSRTCIIKLTCSKEIRLHLQILWTTTHSKVNKNDWSLSIHWESDTHALTKTTTESEMSTLQCNFCGRFFEVSIEQHKSKS